MRLYRVGEGCAVLDLGAPADGPQQRRLWALAAALRHEPEWREVVPGVGNLCVFFDPLQTEAEAALQRLSEGWAQARPVAEDGGRTLRLSVRYGGAAGPDLVELARGVGLSAEAVVALHSGAHYTVQCLGFLPGFAYLDGLPKALHWPRRASPRPRVPAGAVGIGGGQTGVYSVASPGGWNLIGRCRERLFDPQREPASLLLPGDRLQFVVEALDA